LNALSALPDTLLQKFSSAVQYIPVVAALSQSMLPHAQLRALAEVPSVNAHLDGLEHVLVSATHTMPVPAPSPRIVHVASPHAQGILLIVFAADPSVMRQGAAALQQVNASHVETSPLHGELLPLLRLGWEHPENESHVSVHLHAPEHSRQDSHIKSS
jgi:hypothetical protein